MEVAMQFQSTLPRREWPVTCFVVSADTDFNPHSRVGSDDLLRERGLELRNFNPHSRVGSDADKTKDVSYTLDFNPHSRVGSDANETYNSLNSNKISIHTPA